MSCDCAAVGVYRPRRPRASPLYRLVEAHYSEVKGQWEERFERRCGFWRGFVDEQVKRYLDCGRFENGFARIRCPDCHDEHAAELLFRHKVLRLLQGAGLLSEERTQLLLSWRHTGLRVAYGAQR